MLDLVEGFHLDRSVPLRDGPCELLKDAQSQLYFSLGRICSCLAEVALSGLVVPLGGWHCWTGVPAGTGSRLQAWK